VRDNPGVYLPFRWMGRGLFPGATARRTWLYNRAHSMHARCTHGARTVHTRFCTIVHNRYDQGLAHVMGVSVDSDELLTIEAAARAAERSEATIRRWIRAGELTSVAGVAPNSGGRAPACVRARDLFAYLAMSGQQPRVNTSAQAITHAQSRVYTHAQTPSIVATQPGEKAHEPGTPAMGNEALALRVELVRMEGRCDVLRVELDAARARMELVEAERSRLTAELVEARRDRDDWRERHDAREAELRALRAGAGLPWWRRLLQG
jgi:hypothetical protein